MDLDYEVLFETFRVESEDHLREMEEALISLEAQPYDDEKLQIVFRNVHTIKGTSSCIGVFPITEFAHAIEDYLECLRDRLLSVSPALITLLLKCVDTLRQMVATVQVHGSEELPAQKTIQEMLVNEVKKARKRPRPIPAVTVQDPAPPQIELRNRPATEYARTLRVDIKRLDALMNLITEIAIVRGRLGQLLESIIGKSGEEIRETHQEADRLYMDLQELVMKARMVPVGPVFRQHVRTVRDLTEANGKVARLLIEGEEVEVDTAVVEHLKDPITHMIRNALDHGIELPERRQAKGKDPCGKITLKAYHDSGSIVMCVSDDGEGLNRKRIEERARSRGIFADPEKLTDAEAYRLIFEPGFSTSDTVTEFSGRGVGMDVVRRNVEALHGSVAVDSVEGQGTTITIRLPLTLAIIDGFAVGVAGETYVLPLSSVVECLELPEADNERGVNRGILNLRGKPLPYVRLRELFELESSIPNRQNVVVVQHDSSWAGIAVDALYGESQAVIKPLGKMFTGLPGIAGSTILGSGRVALILDVPTLLREAINRQAAA